MRIYAFGCLPPHENAQRVHEQLRLACSYQQALTLIERERRGAVDALYHNALPKEYAEVETADAAAKEAAARVSMGRARPGDMLEPDEEMQAEARAEQSAALMALVEARETQKASWQALKVARKALTPKLRPRLKEIDQEARVRAKFAYNAAGSVSLAWGTRLKMAEAAERAAKASAQHGSLPRLPRFDGGGILSVQIQGEWLRPGDVPPDVSLAELRSRLAVKHQKKWCAVKVHEGALWLLDEEGSRTDTIPVPATKAEQQYWYEPREMDLIMDTRVSREAAQPVAKFSGARQQEKIVAQKMRLDALRRSPLPGDHAKIPREEEILDRMKQRQERMRVPRAKGASSRGPRLVNGVWVYDRDPNYKPDGLLLPLPPPVSGSRRSENARLSTIRLRIGSNGRDPVWASFALKEHRSIPADAPIKWVQIEARKIGLSTEWRLLVTVDDARLLPKPREGGETLAVNLGWRNLKDGGLRVAYAVGTDGYQEEVRVPPQYISGVAKIDSIRSIRDKAHDAARKFLSEWMEEGDRPQWLEAEVRYLDQWRSPKKLARLVVAWRERRFDGDEKVYALLNAWVGHDRHLYYWESNGREKLLAMRLDCYRCIAARWAEKYSRILVTDMDLRDFAERPAVEDGAKTEGHEQRRSRTLAAPSVIRGSIANACSTRGSVLEERPGYNKTRAHNACGLVLARAARQDVELFCECGKRFDQDANHCLNLLASRERGGGEPRATGGRSDAAAPPEGGKKEAGGRWKKRRSQHVSQDVDSAIKSA